MTDQEIQDTIAGFDPVVKPSTVWTFEYILDGETRTVSRETEEAAESALSAICDLIAIGQPIALVTPPDDSPFPYLVTRPVEAPNYLTDVAAVHRIVRAQDYEFQCQFVDWAARGIGVQPRHNYVEAAVCMLMCAEPSVQARALAETIYSRSNE